VSISVSHSINFLFQGKPLSFKGLQHLLQLSLLGRVLIVGEQLQVVLGLFLNSLKVPIDCTGTTEHPDQPLRLL